MAALVETPSGKGAGDENFPVGSWLLAPRLRPHIALFYAYARAIDDIADNTDVAPADKVARLDGFEAAITGKLKGAPGFEKAERLRRSLLETGVSPVHCVDLVSAFKQDATMSRYRDWDDLMDYCNRSAAPVGRYLLDLHGESKAGYPASDALCNALQVINHLQDCKSDYLRLNRVYLPQEWMAEARVDVAELGAAKSSPGLRRVLDQALDGVDDLLAGARQLPGDLKSRRLAMESSAIVRIAERLARLLRQRDPVAERVELSPPAFALCCLTGVWRVVAAA
jgi:squalene synthase HpnC